MASTNLMTTGGGSSKPPKISINFGPNASPESFGTYSRAVLTSIMKEAGVYTVWITSTYRDAHGQARVMVGNIEKKGAAHQKKLYGHKPGSRLVDLYERERTAVRDAERRGIDTGVKGSFALQQHLIGVLERGIEAIGQEKVSNHSGLQAILNVFDVAPNTMTVAQQGLFVKAARRDPRVTRILEPPQDPAYHFEIAQLGDFELNSSTRATA